VVRVLVAIPVFNEARYVRGVLEQVLRHGRDVLVVDDGSTDGTAAILDQMPRVALIRHASNRGYGRSLIDAFEYASSQSHDWIITLDCDDQHKPAQIPEFIRHAARDDADIISGSRYLRPTNNDTPAPAARRKINRRITRLLNRTLGLALTDAFCGFKAYRVAAVEPLPLTEEGYAFPIQFWIQAAHHRLRIRELPVARIYHDPSRTFGGVLDDPEARLAHYLDVFRAELAVVGQLDSNCTSPCAGLVGDVLEMPGG